MGNNSRQAEVDLVEEEGVDLEEDLNQITHTPLEEEEEEVVGSIGCLAEAMAEEEVQAMAEEEVQAGEDGAAIEAVASTLMKQCLRVTKLQTKEVVRRTSHRNKAEWAATQRRAGQTPRDATSQINTPIQ